jgi:hypothetical protein
MKSQLFLLSVAASAVAFPALPEEKADRYHESIYKALCNKIHTMILRKILTTSQTQETDLVDMEVSQLRKAWKE